MRCFAFLLLLALVPPALAQGPPPITVLHPDGATTDAHLAGLSGQTMRIFDAERRLTTLATATAAVLTLRDPPEDAPVPAGVLRMTDGQRLAGRWVGAADAGESLRWAHPTLGAVVVPLDRVAGWTTTAGPPLAADANGADVVGLSSGERLTGFLYLPDAAADSQLLMLAPADNPDGPAVPVPAASVAAVRLANPAAAADAAPARVSLHDGSRLHAFALNLGGSTAAFDAHVAGKALKVEVPSAAVRRVVFTDGGRDAHDLADLPAQTTPPPAAADALWGPGIAGAIATPLGVRLTAPAQHIVLLPPGATHVVGRVVLDLPAGLPPERAAWAGCVLRIDGKSPVELDLSAAHAQATFRVSVPVGTTKLTFTLDPGPRGPVLDVVRIEDTLVLTATPPGGASRSVE